MTLVGAPNNNNGANMAGNAADEIVPAFQPSLRFANFDSVRRERAGHEAAVGAGAFGDPLMQLNANRHRVEDEERTASTAARGASARRR